MKYLTIILLFVAQLATAQQVFEANQINWGGNLKYRNAEIRVYPTEIVICHEPNIFRQPIIDSLIVDETEFYKTVKYNTQGGMVLIEYNPIGIEKVDVVLSNTVINFRHSFVTNKNE